ncbi:nucleolar protein 14, partial [Thamnocephalis sphaerospora]
SALKRLKQSLSSAGLIGPTARTQHGKNKQKKTRGAAGDAGAMAERKKRLAQVEQALNPFETKTTRQKHEVVGRKTKGIVGRPGLTKQVGEEKRRKTLLVEMHNKNKAGGIVDRRFGENDTNMSLEDKMLERFTKERQRRSRSGGAGARTFNLEDDGSGDESGLMNLTHMGQSLADIDEFDDYGLGASDDEQGASGKGAISRDIVSQLHFGGFEPVDSNADPDRQKTRAEVMKE